MSHNAVIDSQSAYLSAAMELRDNPEQWKAYESTGNCVVLAGPGSGKTKTLTVKMARILAEDVRNPRGVACITYNNECTVELRRRLNALGVTERRNVYIGTIHAFCLKNVVLPYANLAGIALPKDVAVASDGDQDKHFAAAVAEVLGQNARPEDSRLACEKYRRTHLDRDVPSWLGDDPEYAAIIESYERRLRSAGLLDFEDMVLLGLKLIECEPWICACLRARFPILVVDEYQDLGPALHRIVKKLCFASGVRLFAVGDPDQSIYGFAGAQPELLQELSELDSVERIQLRDNYRCGERIIEAAEIALGENRAYKARGKVRGHLTARKCPGGLQEQAEVACREIVPAALKRRDGRRIGDCAVLYVDRHGGSVIENCARAENLKYIRIDRGAAYRKTQLIRWLESCASFCADSSIEGARKIPVLIQQWEHFNSSVSEERSVHRLRIRLVRFLHDHQDANQELSLWLKEFEVACLGETLDREKMLRDEKSAFRELKNACSKSGSLAGLTVGVFGGSKDHLNLITLHSAKGLEFDVVVIIGLDQGAIPRYRASPAEKKEAGRLFYVGLTRAKHEVHFLYSGFVEKWGRRYENGPSEFLIRLSKGLKKKDGAA